MIVLLEITLLLLLLLNVLFIYRLNKKIAVMKESNKEFVTYIETFDQAILQAKNNLKDTKKIMKDLEITVDKKIKEANSIIESLDYLAKEDKSNSKQKNLENIISNISNFNKNEN